LISPAALLRFIFIGLSAALNAPIAILIHMSAMMSIAIFLAMLYAPK
jgi:hypothetical protein